MGLSPNASFGINFQILWKFFKENLLKFGNLGQTGVRRQSQYKKTDGYAQTAEISYCRLPFAVCYLIYYFFLLAFLISVFPFDALAAAGLVLTVTSFLALSFA